MTAATCVVFTSGLTSGVQRTTRPVQCNTTSVGVPIASAGILMVKLTILPTTKEVANSNNTPLAEMFSVTAGRSPDSVQMVSERIVESEPQRGVRQDVRYRLRWKYPWSD